MGNCQSDGVPRTAFKKVDDSEHGQHARLYPTLDDSKDYLECVDAEHASYRFASDDMENATQHLLQNGFVVIKSVLNREEIEKGKSLLWEFAEPFGFDRKDYKSWNIYNIGGECENGLVWGKGMGQSDFQWFGRKNEKVRKVFADIWSHDAFPLNSRSQNASENVVKIGGHEFVPNIKGLDEISDSDEAKEVEGIDGSESSKKKKDKIVVDPAKDLLTSFDGIGLFTPWYLTDENDRTNSGWYHIDQNPVRKKGIHTIQGYVTYFDQNESTGSTVFIPKTHLEVEESVDAKQMGDFIRVRANNKLRDSSLFKKILLCCCAGDMVLWDSRTIHCNSPALLSIEEMKKVHIKKNKSGKVEAPDLLRLVSMICMVPKCRLKKKTVLKQRVKAYVRKETCSHWPIEYSPLVRNPNVGVNDIEKADDLTKSLIGYT